MASILESEALLVAESSPSTNSCLNFKLSREELNYLLLIVAIIVIYESIFVKNSNLWNIFLIDTSASNFGFSILRYFTKLVSVSTYIIRGNYNQRHSICYLLLCYFV